MIKEKKSSKRITRKEKELKSIKGYKAVEWVRKVRDKMYEENKNLSMKNYVKAILKDKY